MSGKQIGVSPLVCVVCEQPVGVINTPALEEMLNYGEAYICTACAGLIDDENQGKGAPASDAGGDCLRSKPGQGRESRASRNRKGHRLYFGECFLECPSQAENDRGNDNTKRSAKRHNVQWFHSASNTLQ